MTHKVGLIILDGWGYGKKDHSDAVFQAKTPVFDNLVKQYPNATLTTFGEAVGLPEGQMGNSEVGHLNIGAGRVVYQELTRINKEIREGNFIKNKQLNRAIALAKETNKALHLFGLLSKGGVHSHQEHAVAICKYATEQGVPNIYVHAFTDGRDCDPMSGKDFVAEFEQKTRNTNAKVATVIGRYYAMDRDLRWERVQQAYKLLAFGEGQAFSSAEEAIQTSYDNGITDEFIKPVVLNNFSGIKDGDVLISFNFRTDRPREIVTALTQKAIPEYNMKPLNVEMFTMTSYDATYQDVSVLYEKQNLQKTLGEVVSAAGKTQVRTAETEKYPHVTFFFNGGQEEPFASEERLLIHSPKVATYDLQPEMSAPEVTTSIVNYIHEKQPDFICLNFANPDMVGHTGVFEAIVKAVETVDTGLGEIINAGNEYGYEWIVIADHGNADFAVNEDGTPNTAHSTNPVPVILVTTDKVSIKSGKLADVAPTILERMGLPKPAEMDGESLICH
jgi:2,3-bisphosphoglycerate-independent phosphoglycerate mutase